MAYVARRNVGWFDGIDDYVEAQNFTVDSDDYTIFLCFRIPYFRSTGSGIPGNENYSIFMIGGAYDGIELLVPDGGSQIGLRYLNDLGSSNQMLYWTANASPVDGKWHWLALRVKGRQYVEMWLDGYLGSRTVPSKIVELIDKSLHFGHGYYGYKLVEFGVVAIWNRELSDDEIARLSEDPFDSNNIPRDGLVGWWDFNKADWENGILPDLSGNGNDGTMYGVAQKPVLVKRGAGELPKWDLKYEWWSDSIDDTVTVDVNSQFLNNDLSIVWCAPGLRHDAFGKDVVEPYAGGVGHYDDTESAWVVDVGEKGYFFDSGIMEGAFQRLSWWYWEVKVADNTQNVPMFRAELYNEATGELIASVDVMADSYLTDGYISWQAPSSGLLYAFLPNGKYRLLLYSYGNVKFWIRKVIYEMSHMYLVYNPSVYFRLYWGVNSGWGSSLGIRDIDGNAYYCVGSLSDGNNVDKPIFQMYAVSLDVQKYRSEDGKVNDYSRSVNGWNMSFTYFNIPQLSNNRTFIGRIHTIMLYDRYLDDTEFADMYGKKFVLDGLLHWWVVREDGYLVDLVTGKEYEIQGNPLIREIYDKTGKFNSGTGVIVWDIIKDERGV